MQTSNKAVIYTRVSTEEQAESGTSLIAQFSACLQKAQQLTIQVLASFEDAGVSGAYYMSRPGLQAALKALEEKRADTLIVANVSRLSRDSEHQSAIRKRVVAAGGKIVFCDFELAATPEGDLAFGIMGNFAQYERQVIRERTMKGRRRRAEEGIQPARAESPYGYHIPTKADVLRGEWPAETLGTYQVLKDRAVFVREVFDRCAAGESLRGICRWLTSVGAPTSQGGKAWYQTSLLCILRNSAYKGVGVYGRTQQFTDERRREQGFRHSTYSRTRVVEEWQTFPVPALVPETVWNACQRRLDGNKERLSGNPRRKYLLSGMARCGLCGRGMMGFRTNAGNAYYRCRDANQVRKDGEITCFAGCCSMTEIENLVLSGILQIVGSPDIIASALEEHRLWRVQSERPTAGERERIEAEISALEKREQATISAQIAGIAAGARPDAYTKEFQEIVRQRAMLEEQRQKFSAEANCTDEPEDAAEIACQALRNVAEVLSSEDISVEEKHRFLSRVIDKIIPDSKFTEGGLQAVDIHVMSGGGSDGTGVTVQRFTNRWGYVAAKTPEKTMAALHEVLPPKYRVEINRLLVPFGKHLCTGMLPHCSTCPVLSMCQQVGVEKAHR